MVELIRPAVADPVPNEDFSVNLDEKGSSRLRSFVGSKANEKGDEVVAFVATVSAGLVPNDGATKQGDAVELIAEVPAAIGNTVVDADEANPADFEAEEERFVVAPNLNVNFSADGPEVTAGVDSTLALDNQRSSVRTGYRRKASEG